jgi:hypothetical protein
MLLGLTYYNFMSIDYLILVIILKKVSLSIKYDGIFFFCQYYELKVLFFKFIEKLIYLTHQIH